MIDNPNAKTCWKTVRFPRDRALEVVVVVETDLVISEDDDGYDGGAMFDLQSAIADFLDNNPSIHAVELHRITPGNDA